MTKPTPANQLTRRSALIAMAAMSTSLASAQVQVHQYVQTPSGIEFEYRLTGLPDFDQRRAFGTFGVPAGLPADGGMYCGPTSASNIMAYLANHGHPDLPPFPADWELPGQYEPATLNIAAMGAMMGTHPIDGTGSGGVAAGYEAWFAQYPEGRFVMESSFADGYFSPTLDSMTESVLSTGGLAAFWYGRYQVQDVDDELIDIGDRVGGHCLTFNRAKRTSIGGLLGYRDPADNSDSLTTQSPFQTRLVGVDDKEIKVYSSSLGQDIVRTMSPLDSDVKVGENVRLIDEVDLVYPKLIMSIGPLELALYIPFPPVGSGLNPLQEVSYSSLAPIQDAALAPGLASFVTLTDPTFGSPALALRHRITGQVQTIATIAGATDVAVGRNRQIYVGGGTQLRRYDLDRPAGSQLLATINVSFDVSDIFYNDATDELVVLSIPDRRILRYPAKFTILSTATVNIVPAAVPLAGDGSVIVNPLDGKHWVLSTASNSLYGLTLAATGVAVQTLTMPAITDPTGFDFDDRGHMFVNNHGQMVELQQVPGPTAGWQVSASQFFAGFQPGGGPVIRVARSRTNRNPAEHDEPGWNVNIHPSLMTFDPAAPACPDDFNGDDLVNGIDLATLLAGWSPAAGSAASCGGITPCPQDLNHDARVNGLDLAALLAGWGACH